MILLYIAITILAAKTLSHIYTLRQSMDEIIKEGSGTPELYKVYKHLRIAMWMAGALTILSLIGAVVTIAQ